LEEWGNAMGFASKNARKKLSHLRRIVSEFNAMDVTIQRVGIQSGDVLFFKVQTAPSAEVLEAFLQHLHTKGLRDCMAMIVGPDDVIETLSAARLDELARAAGYVRGDGEAEAQSNQQKGRRQVLNLLRRIAVEDDARLNMLPPDYSALIERVNGAIETAEQKGKIAEPVQQPPAEVPVESAVDSSVGATSEPPPPRLLHTLLQHDEEFCRAVGRTTAAVEPGG